MDEWRDRIVGATIYDDLGKLGRRILGRSLRTRDVWRSPLESTVLRLQKDIKMADAYMAATAVNRPVDFYRDRHEAGD